ncbi:MAG TPA: alpha/beta hydrolase, partial [Rhizomicrobium sp.]
VREMLANLIGGPDTPFMARRAQAEAFAAAFVKPDGIAIEAGELGGVPVEWITPDGAHPRQVFFHLHGGGYVLGNPAGSRAFTTDLALRARCRVVSVDYRLAPEHPFPAAVDDAVAAYRALLAQGTAPGDVAIGGESAGGGLAVATLLAARTEGLPMPGALVAISPWTDMRCTAESFESQAAKDPLLTRRSLKEMADAYMASSDPRHPFASPALGDLSGLPPMLIHVGSDEVLLDDAGALAAAARSHGVEATLEVWPRMIHVWHMFHPMLPEGADAMRDVASFIRGKWQSEKR